MVTTEKRESEENDAANSTSNAAKRNVRVIAQLENAALNERSLMNRISDVITRFAGSGTFVGLHVAWFTFWLVMNTGKIAGVKPFDPFPFTFLTMIVSLEAIFLSIFVLISQNRMARHTDQRAHLDLQINLLAEQEMTMMLKMLQRLCEKAGVQAEIPNKELQSLVEKTDPHTLMQYLQKTLPES
jgi:uncharacterized membrane protein